MIPSPNFRGFSVSEENELTKKGFTLAHKLGYGSYSQVFQVIEERKNYYGPGLHRKATVACKVVDVSRTPTNFVQKFFPRELEILTKIRHPYIISTHTILQRKKKYYIFMRYCEGGDLLEYIQLKGEIGESRTRLWINQIALALNYLHNLSIVHRDIKCENVLVTINMNVKLTDFGFARSILNSDGRYVMSQTFCGSLPYTAPEVLEGFSYDGRKSDMWSLGIVMYVMLNRSLPFQSDSAKVMVELQMTNQPIRHRQKTLASTTELVRWTINQLLNIDPIARWSSQKLISSKWINTGRGKEANEFMQNQRYPQDTRNRADILRALYLAADSAARNLPTITVIKQDIINKSNDSIV